MKTNLRLTLAAFGIALLGRLIFESNLQAQGLAPQTIGEKQSIYATADISYGQVAFSGGVAGNWLTVQRHNIAAYDRDGYNPSFTSATSDFKPIVTKRKDGKYEIQFESEIASNLP